LIRQVVTREPPMPDLGERRIITQRNVRLMVGDQGEWIGPGGVRVSAVRLTGSHRMLADLAGVWGETAFLVTRRGALVGYFTSVEELAEVVDLAELRME